MSTHDQEPGTDITDDQLPQDLVPADDNPLAEGLEDGETVDGLLDEGKDADESTKDDPTEQPGDE